MPARTVHSLLCVQIEWPEVTVACLRPWQRLLARCRRQCIMVLEADSADYQGKPCLSSVLACMSAGFLRDFELMTSAAEGACASALSLHCSEVAAASASLCEQPGIEQPESTLMPGVPVRVPQLRPFTRHLAYSRTLSSLRNLMLVLTAHTRTCPRTCVAPSSTLQQRHLNLL